jgi:hypothetical protein
LENASLYHWGQYTLFFLSKKKVMQAYFKELIKIQWGCDNEEVPLCFQAGI